MVIIRRVYDQRQPDETYSVFVDRLWPRGLSKQQANWDEWLKEVSPSAELRKWFKHDPTRWDEFKLQYSRELTRKLDHLKRLKSLEAQYGKLTLVYGAKDRAHSHAIVIKEMLDQF